MKFKRHPKLSFELKPIDIIPLINILFLLLMFFMFSSSFTSQSGINVKLPKTITSDVLKKENFIITITSENLIYFNGTIITLKELGEKIDESNLQNHTLLLKTDRRASFGRIVDVWNLCRNSGIEKINIATNQLEYTFAQSPNKE